jgi:sugar phosphate isomerase/epimerase
MTSFSSAMSPRRHSLPCLLALSIVTVACASGHRAGTSSAPTGGTTAAGRETPGFTFTGDFSGPLGLQLYSVRTAIAKDVPGTLARVRALGFSEVELAGTYGLSAQQFRQELDRAGLRATSMHTGYERLRDSLEAVLAEARTLGVRYVGPAWIPHPQGQSFTDAMARQTAADFNRWGRAARAAGLQFFYHIHGYEFQPGPGGTLPMDVLMRETDPEAVKFELDVFWATRPGQDPSALLRKYPDRWELMHLKDMRKGVPTGDHSGTAPPDETEVPVGTGQIDYRAVLRTAKDIGLDRYYIEDETSDPFATIPQSIRWLETVRY